MGPAEYEVGNSFTIIKIRLSIMATASSDPAEVCCVWPGDIENFWYSCSYDPPGIRGSNRHRWKGIVLQNCGKLSVYSWVSNLKSRIRKTGFPNTHKFKHPSFSWSTDTPIMKIKIILGTVFVCKSHASISVCIHRLDHKKQVPQIHKFAYWLMATSSPQRRQRVTDGEKNWDP